MKCHQPKLLVTVWWFGNQENFRQIADRFSTTWGINNFMIGYCSYSNEHRCIKHFKLGNAYNIVRSKLVVLGENATYYILSGRQPRADKLDEIVARYDFSKHDRYYFSWNGECVLFLSKYSKYQLTKFHLTSNDITGNIDTTSISIKPPLRHLAAYTDRESKTSVKI